MSTWYAWPWLTWYLELTCDPGCQGRGSKFGIFSSGCVSRLAGELLRTRWGAPGSDPYGNVRDQIPPKCHTFAKKSPAFFWSTMIPKNNQNNPLVWPKNSWGVGIWGGYIWILMIEYCVKWRGSCLTFKIYCCIFQFFDYSILRRSRWFQK